AGGVGNVGSQAGLARARSPGNEHAAAAVESRATQHGIKTGDAGGDPLVRRFLTQGYRGDGQNGDAVFVDQEGVLVGAVEAAAVLDDAQPACRELFGDAVVQHNDTVRDVLLQTVAGKHAVAALAGNDRRDLFVLEPAEQAPQLRAEHRSVVQAAKEGLDRVQHNTLGTDRINGVAQADEEPFEIVLAGLLDLAGLDIDVIDQEFVLADQLLQVDAEGADVPGQVTGRLLKGHEDTVLTELGHAANEELRREQSLSATRAAAHERGAAARQAAAGDFLQRPYRG